MHAVKNNTQVYYWVQNHYRPPPPILNMANFPKTKNFNLPSCVRVSDWEKHRVFADQFRPLSTNTVGQNIAKEQPENWKNQKLYNGYLNKVVIIEMQIWDIANEKPEQLKSVTIINHFYPDCRVMLTCLEDS